MIEAYAFFAAFTVQILAASVLLPAGVIRRARWLAASLPAERLAQVYPGVDVSLTLERYLTRYRALNTGIAVLGLLLLGWLFSSPQRPDLADGTQVTRLLSLYATLQILPFLVAGWFQIRFDKALRRSLPESKHKATLQRRGLFDFVSPFAVFLAVLVYVLFAALMIYIHQHYPFPDSDRALFNLGVVTLAYAVIAFAGYRQLYGKKKNPLETHADRVHRIGLGVKMSVYISILFVVYVSLITTIQALDLDRWRPFAVSVYSVIIALLMRAALTAPPRQPDAEELGPSPAS